MGEVAPIGGGLKLRECVFRWERLRVELRVIRREVSIILVFFLGLEIGGCEVGDVGDGETSSVGSGERDKGSPSNICGG